MQIPRRARIGLFALLALTLLAVPALALTLTATPGQADRVRAGTLTTASAPSAALGEPIDYTVYLPYRYDRGKDRYPVLYLLHGRGDTMQAWTRVKSTLDQMIAAKTIPPIIAVMPDAPWSERGSWYVDSRYTTGKPVESALTGDLVKAVDAAYRTAPIRQARMVGGYSMGGAGALRYVLAHQDLFGSAIVLAPAVYTPLPPSDSSTRDYGAFGEGSAKFVDEIYQRQSYPQLLPKVNPDLPVRLFIAVGDDEYANPDPADARHDLDFEAAALYNAARRAPGVSAEFRVVDGGHDWAAWAPAFEQALTHLGPALSVVPPTPLPTPALGTAVQDWAGGVAAHADGSLTVGLAAGGPVDGREHKGRLDAVLTRRNADGSTRWTTQLGTAADERLYGVAALPDGGVLAAGYTKGDLDGKHAGNATDDAFVVRLNEDGSLRWTTQFGVPGMADRLYGLAAAPDGGAYVTGYTKGDLGGANAGDKDVILARLGPDGRLAWTRQLGGTGEDKAYGVAVSGSEVYAVGSATAALPGTTALGGLDGWIAAYGADGTPRWSAMAGGAGDDRLNAVAATSTGPVVTGGQAGDLLAAAYSAQGTRRWATTIATPSADEGAAVVALPGGDISLAGYTRGRIGVVAGGADVLTARLTSSGRQVSAEQFGSAHDDGVDPFSEVNLYATATQSGSVAITGLTYGTSATGDVFVRR